MSSLARRLVWVFALVGLCASLSSLYVHHQLVMNPSYTSFCDVNETVSCTQAYLSRYGSFMGVPVALLGALWFAFVLVLAALERGSPAGIRESYPAYLFVLSTIGLAIILYLGYAAFFVLKVVCVLCLITYAAVIGLFIVSGAATRFPMTTLPRRFLADARAMAGRPVALLVLVLFLAGAATAVAFFPGGGGVAGQQIGQAPPTADAQAKFERWWVNLPRVTVPVPSEGAAVLIVKFTDLQCPSCGQSYVTDRPIIARYQAQYPGQVKFVAKDYPLQPDCNPNVPRPIHLASCDAAVAVRLAKQNGKGDALEEYFYTHQALISPASVREAAQVVGGVRDFDGQYQRGMTLVKTDISLGRLLGVHVTPTFFVNGVKVEGGMAPQAMDLAIAYELKKAGKTK